MLDHLFFDLDHTLWDFDTNAEETLRELYDHYQVKFLTPHGPDTFIAIYTQINHDLWKLYRNHQITKDKLRVKRFEDTFKTMGVAHKDIPMNIGEKYIEICPTKTALLPGAIETLDYLYDRYELHIITNGFEESQLKKMHHANLTAYFKSITISEHVGKQKPHPLVFETALKNAKSTTISGTYIGDNLDADIKGSIQSGWKAFWLTDDPRGYSDPNCQVISNLRTLKDYF